MRHRVNHNEGCQGTGNKAGGNREKTASGSLTAMVTAKRLNQKPKPNDNDNRLTDVLQQGRAACAGDCLLNNDKAGEDQHDRHADMREHEDGARANALQYAAGPAKIIGDEHALTMAGHKRMYHAEQDGKGHCAEQP